MKSCICDVSSLYLWRIFFVFVTYSVCICDVTSLCLWRRFCDGQHAAGWLAVYLSRDRLQCSRASAQRPGSGCQEQSGRDYQFLAPRLDSCVVARGSRGPGKPRAGETACYLDVCAQDMCRSNHVKVYLSSLYSSLNPVHFIDVQYFCN